MPAPAPRTPSPAETTRPIPAVPAPRRSAPRRDRHAGVPLPREAGRSGVPLPRDASHSGGVPAVRRPDAPGTGGPRHAAGPDRPATRTGGHPVTRRAAPPDTPAERTGELPAVRPVEPPAGPVTSTGGHPAIRPTDRPATITGSHPAITALDGPATRTGSHPVTRRAAPPDDPAERTGELPAVRPLDGTGRHPATPGRPVTATGGHPAVAPLDAPATRTGGHPAVPRGRLHGPVTHTGSHPLPAPAERLSGPVTRTGSHPTARPTDRPAATTGGHPAVAPLDRPATRTGEHPLPPRERLHGPVTRTGSHPTIRPTDPVTATGGHPATAALDGPGTRAGEHPVARPAGPVPGAGDGAGTADPEAPTPAHGVRQLTADPEPATGAVLTCGCEPVLTASFRPDGTAASLAEHLEAHGAPRRMRRGELTDLVDAALVRGRGGAGFPLARKLTAAARSRKAPEVVVNGAESEPASVKDRMLLTRAPHLVLDGAQLLADEIGARGITVWVHDGAAADTVGHAVGERDDRVPVTVVRAPDGYLAGESSAALAHLGGGPARPAFALRPAAVQGPYGRPVVVSNAESVAAVAALVAHGLERHRSFGTPDEPGTRLLTVHRAPGEPVLVEASTGVPVLDALVTAGAATDVAAVLVGGYFGRWLAPPAGLAAPLSHAGMDAAGGALGAGVVLAPAPGSCLLGEVAEVVDQLAAQSAGQCGPCVNGLPALARTIDALVAGDAPRKEVARVHELAASLAGRGACRHPDGVTMFAASAVDVLAAEVAAHRAGGCDAPNRGWLPLPVPAESPQEPPGVPA